MKCELDCFECPYTDCICDGSRNIHESFYKKECKKKEMSPERREKYLAYCKNYYQKNKEKMNRQTQELKTKRREEAKREQGALLDFGAWLYEERTKRELTQTEFGNLLLTDTYAISKFEQGKRVPNFSTLSFFADRLGYELRLVKKGEA